MKTINKMEMERQNRIDDVLLYIYFSICGLACLAIFYALLVSPLIAAVKAL